MLLPTFDYYLYKMKLLSNLLHLYYMYLVSTIYWYIVFRYNYVFCYICITCIWFLLSSGIIYFGLIF